MVRPRWLDGFSNTYITAHPYSSHFVLSSFHLQLPGLYSTYLNIHNSTNLLSLIFHSSAISIHPPSLPVQISPSQLNTPALPLSVILPPLVLIPPFPQLSSSSAFLDTSRVTWTFQIGVSILRTTSLFFSLFFPLTLLTVFNIFFFSAPLFPFSHHL